MGRYERDDPDPLARFGEIPEPVRCPVSAAYPELGPERPRPSMQDRRFPDIRNIEGLSAIREHISFRDREVRVSERELALMTELGKFRVIAQTDLGRYYQGTPSALTADIRNLREQGLLSQRRILISKRKHKLLVLTLTKQGKRLLRQEQAAPSTQALYAGLVKPQEVPHDAAIYRMYQVETERIESKGGNIHRVVLDYELKKKVYSPLAKARKTLTAVEYKQRQAEVAATNGLKVVDGRIPLPDLRIEYATAEGELTKVDLELATEHYHGRHALQKLRAGFKTYADRESASRLNAAISHGRSSIYDGPELTAGILSL